MCLYLSYVYKKDELNSRLSCYYVANPLTTIISSPLAFGILCTRGPFNSQSWRWLFLLEGLVTFIVGFFSFFQMVPSVVQTRSKWRTKGWFTEREEKIMVNRILRDDPAKGDMHNRESLTLKALFYALLDYDMFPLYAIRMFTDIRTAPLGTYFTLTLRPGIQYF